MYDSSNPYVNRDPRFYASIYYNGADFMDRKIETYKGGYDVTNQDATMTGYYIRKFIEEDKGISQTRALYRSFPVIPVIRNVSQLCRSSIPFGK